VALYGAIGFIVSSSAHVYSSLDVLKFSQRGVDDEMVRVRWIISNATGGVNG